MTHNYTSVFACIILTIAVSSCSEASDTNMKKASATMKDAGIEMKEAVKTFHDSVKAAAVSDWNEFKTSSEVSITGMEKQSDIFEEKLARANEEGKDDFKRQLNHSKDRIHVLKYKLQKRNVEFENDLQLFDSTVILKNRSFENAFKQDMNELGAALQNLFSSKVK